MTWLAKQLEQWNDHKIVDDDPRVVCWLLARLVEFENLLDQRIPLTDNPALREHYQALKDKVDNGPLHDREGYSLNDESESCAPFSARTRWAANKDPV